jgi:hypothetical protein
MFDLISLIMGSNAGGYNRIGHGGLYLRNHAGPDAIPRIADRSKLSAGLRRQQ